MRHNFDEIFEMFLDNLEIEKDISKTTKSSYTNDFNIFREFLRRQGIKEDISLINKHILKKYFHFLKFEKDYSVATMRRKIHSLSSFFKFLYEDDIIDNNPMKSIKALKRPKELPIYINNDDMTKILSSVDTIGGNFVLRDKCFFLLLFLTGVRRNELINLRWKNVDFSNNTIEIYKSKGNKSRIVPMISPLNTYLKLLFNSKITDLHDYVLYSHTLNKMNASCATRLFNKYIKANNLEGKDYSLHKCRHTFATNLAMNNMDSLEIAELLGHEDIDTTKIYIHLSKASLNSKISNTSYAKSISKLMDGNLNI